MDSFKQLEWSGLTSKVSQCAAFRGTLWFNTT